jgi:hypothetical protein
MLNNYLFNTLSVIETSSNIIVKDDFTDITVTATTQQGDTIKLEINTNDNFLLSILDGYDTVQVRYDVHINDLRMVGNGTIETDEFKRVRSAIKRFEGLRDKANQEAIKSLFDQYLDS